MTLMDRLLALLAPDGFRGRDGVLGGDLVDTGTAFAMRDKVGHVIAGAIAQLALERWAFVAAPFFPLFIRWILVITALAVAWELLELLRWQAWQRRGGLGPWPLAADRFSWRDVVATLAGGAAAWAVL